MSKLIEEERLKMIEKVSHDLLGYMPKGIIRDYNDLEPLGEKYKEAYRPKTPDACGDCWLFILIQTVLTSISYRNKYQHKPI